MASGNHTETLTVGGRLMQRNVDATGDNDAGYGGASAPITLVADTAVASWVKSDADTGVATLAAEHGLSSGTYDVYWADGIRYGVDGTVNVNDLELDGGGFLELE